MGLLGLVQQPLVVGEHLLGGDVQAELQGNQDSKLRSKEVPPVQPEYCLGLLYQHLQLVPLEIVQLCSQNEAGTCTELPVCLVDDVPQHQLLKVHISLKMNKDAVPSHYKLLPPEL